MVLGAFFLKLEIGLFKYLGYVTALFRFDISLIVVSDVAFCFKRYESKAVSYLSTLTRRDLSKFDFRLPEGGRFRRIDTIGRGRFPFMETSTLSYFKLHVI